MYDAERWQAWPSPGTGVGAMGRAVEVDEAAAPRIVVIGGGTGIYHLLTGLKNLTPHITAVVTMMDSGGSSGRLRDEFGHLPPGDVRQCLVALCPDDHQSVLLRQLFNYRFRRGRGLSGHTFGNLFLTALTEITGATDLAIAEAARILGIRGRVLPVTLTQTVLCARLVDGREIRGEAAIDQRVDGPPFVPIDYVYLDPKAYAYPPVLAAIAEADAVVLGPGDLYTSLVPNVLVEGVVDALQRTRARRIYVVNLMTKQGESDGFRASDFIRVVREYVGDALDVAVAHVGALPPRVVARYAALGAVPVEVDRAACEELVPALVTGDLANVGTLVRHDGRRLARLVVELATRPAETPAQRSDAPAARQQA